MIEGHGDDSYKYSRPITANFSSNVYNKVNLSPFESSSLRMYRGDRQLPRTRTLYVGSPYGFPLSAAVRSCLRNEWRNGGHIPYCTDFPGYEYSYPATHFQRICGCLPYARTPGEFALSTAEGAGRVSPAGRCADAVALQPPTIPRERWPVKNICAD